MPESASGARERLHFSQMLLSARKHKIQHILTEKVDRISRNFKEAIKLQDWLERDSSRYVHFVKQSLVIGQNSKSSDTFMWDIFLSMARQYSRNLSEEVKKGQKIGINKGLFMGSHKIGYLAHGAKGKSCEGKPRYPNPTMKGVIKDVFERIARGEAVINVCKWAQQDGRLKTNQGGKLHRSRFYTFIRDPFVCGQFYFNNKLYEGIHEPIISKQLFYDVQDILDDKKNRKSASHTYAYRGLVKNSTGTMMNCCTNKGLTYYYRNGVYIREEKITEALNNWFSNMEITDEAIKRFKEASRLYSDSFKEYRKAQLDGKVQPYSLRHTMARWLRKQSVPAWEVSAQLGHSQRDMAITEIYAPHDPAYLEASCKAIDVFFDELRVKCVGIDKILNGYLEQ